MLQEIYTISDLYHTSPPPLPCLLQLKLLGSTSTSTTPQKQIRENWPPGKLVSYKIGLLENWPP